MTRCARCSFSADDLTDHAREAGHWLGNAKGGTPCAAEDCVKLAHSAGYCAMHYARLRRHGNLEGLRPKAPPVERFARHLATGDDTNCWEWLGVKNNKGYGVFMVSNTPTVRMYAHRYAYELLVAPIPDGLHVLHSCDNPVCCNPAHLSLGTHKDNMADMAAKGRSRRKTCRRGHPWTPENTQHFVDSHGYENRRCRQCRRAREGKRAA